MTTLGTAALIATGVVVVGGLGIGGKALYSKLDRVANPQQPVVQVVPQPTLQPVVIDYEKINNSTVKAVGDAIKPLEARLTSLENQKPAVVVPTPVEVPNVVAPVVPAVKKPEVVITTNKGPAEPLVDAAPKTPSFNSYKFDITGDAVADEFIVLQDNIAYSNGRDYVRSTLSATDLRNKILRVHNVDARVKGEENISSYLDVHSGQYKDLVRFMIDTNEMKLDGKSLESKLVSEQEAALFILNVANDAARADYIKEHFIVDESTKQIRYDKAAGAHYYNKSGRNVGLWEFIAGDSFGTGYVLGSAIAGAYKHDASYRRANEVMKNYNITLGTSILGEISVPVDSGKAVEMTTNGVSTLKGILNYVAKEGGKN
jgi:hypothetical protein